MLQGISKWIIYIVLTIVAIMVVLALAGQVGIVRELKQHIQAAQLSGWPEASLQELSRLHKRFTGLLILSFFGFLLLITGILTIMQHNREAFHFSEIQDKVRYSLRRAGPGLLMLTIGCLALAIATYGYSYLERRYSGVLGKMHADAVGNLALLNAPDPIIDTSAKSPTLITTEPAPVVKPSAPTAKTDAKSVNKTAQQKQTATAPAQPAPKSGQTIAKKDNVSAKPAASEPKKAAPAVASAPKAASSTKPAPAPKPAVVTKAPATKKTDSPATKAAPVAKVTEGTKPSADKAAKPAIASNAKQAKQTDSAKGANVAAPTPKLENAVLPAPKKPEADKPKLPVAVAKSPVAETTGTKSAPVVAQKEVAKPVPAMNQQQALQWVRQYQRRVTINGYIPTPQDEKQYDNLHQQYHNEIGFNNDMHWAYTLLSRTRTGYQPTPAELQRYENVISAAITRK